MSKRSIAFKKSLIDHVKKEVLNDMRMRDDYSKEFNDHGASWKEITQAPNIKSEIKILNKLAKMLGLSLNDLITFINDNYKENAFELNQKDRLNKHFKSLSEAFNAGEKKEHERHIKAEDESFQRGKKYGAEQRENELRAKYKFIERRINDLNNEKPSCNLDNKKIQDSSISHDIWCNEVIDQLNKSLKVLDNALKNFNF